MPVAAEFACERIVGVADRSYLLAAEVDIIAENIVFAQACFVLADSHELVLRGDFGEKLPVGKIACAEIVEFDLCFRSRTYSFKARISISFSAEPAAFLRGRYIRRFAEIPDILVKACKVFKRAAAKLLGGKACCRASNIAAIYSAKRAEIRVVIAVGDSSSLPISAHAADS